MHAWVDLNMGNPSGGRVRTVLGMVRQVEVLVVQLDWPSYGMHTPLQGMRSQP